MDKTDMDTAMFYARWSVYDYDDDICRFCDRAKNECECGDTQRDDPEEMFERGRCGR